MVINPSMKNHNSRNLIFSGVSLAILSSIFLFGFYYGSHSENAFLNNRANASEPVDLESFWKVWYILEENFVAASSTDLTTDDEKLYGAIQGLVGSLGDQHTVFFPPVEKKDFDENISGNFSGVGMEIGVRNGLLNVITPLKNSPAEKAGVRAEDVVLMIDGESTSKMTINEAVSKIKGEKGTEVVITVAREGVAETIDISITRDNIKIPTVDTELRSDGVFVISLYNFNANATNDFRRALREFMLAKTDKLILDLRGNPGGFLTAAIDISSWFLPAGKIVVKEDFGGKEDEEVFRSRGYNIFNDNLKMAILVNGGSASASEIVAGALQSHGIAELIGTNTYGKGSVQELMDITEETSLKVTIARWLTPNGKSISDGGLSPDIEVEFTNEDFEAKKDPQLDAAIDYLLK
ncbi:MAG: carboxyl-terminal processing protease [Candidatus Paceibacteria bacterium]